MGVKKEPNFVAQRTLDTLMSDLCSLTEAEDLYECSLNGDKEVSKEVNGMEVNSKDRGRPH